MTTLKKQLDAVEEILSRLRRNREKKLLASETKRLVEPAQREVARIVAQTCDADIRTAHDAVCAAQTAYDIELVGTRSRHPLVGKKMAQWAWQRWPTNCLSKTGTVGIVEVWTRESRYPDHTTSYRMPDYGDLVVRPLKKDGTASLKFYSFAKRRWSENECTGGDPPHGWHLEGVDPNKESA